ncbi:hypothetical protein CU098_010803, partial [Rhizopus stolonifer]
MSLSYIVDFVDEELAAVKFGPVLGQKEKQAIETAVDRFLKKNIQSLKAARAFLFLKLVKLDEQDRVESQAYEILLQIINMIHQSKGDLKQEMDYVAI